MKKMKYRNSVNYSNNKSIKNFNSKYYDNNLCNDKIRKNIFLNNLNRISKNNSNFIKNLNSTFRDYEVNLNQKDIKITKNLYNITVNKVFNMKMKLKHSEQLLREYDEKYEFNTTRDYNKKNNKNIDNILYKSKEKEENSKDNFSMNISNIIENNKNKNEHFYYTPKDNKKKSFNRIPTYNENNFKRYSINCNKKYNINKYMKIIINEKKIRKKMKKIEQLTKLFSAVEVVEKQEIIDENKFFKIDKKEKKFIPFYREKINNKNKININSISKRFKLRKNNDENLSEEKSINSQKITSLSFNKTKTKEKDINNNTYSKIYKDIKQIKLIPKLFLSLSNNKANLNNICINSENLSNIHKLPKSARNKKNIFFSSSFPNFNFSSNNNRRDIKTSLLCFSPKEKNKLNLSIRTYQRNKEISPIIHKTINIGKKINNIIKKNYVLHKEPKIKNNFYNILEDQKLDLEKLRNNLKLKDSNGIYGKINEIQILKNNIRNLRKMMSKKETDIIKTIAQEMINEDLLLNKRLIYNVGLENRINRQKYLELYNILTNSKHRKRILEDNYVFDDNKIYG